MTFPEAMQAVLDGKAVRRAAWGPRRSIRLAVEPWNGQDETLLYCDVLNDGLPLFAYSAKGEDVRASDWQQID